MEAQERRMGLLRKLITYKRMFGWRALIVRCTEKLIGYETRTSGFASDITSIEDINSFSSHAVNETYSAEAFIKSRFAAMAPLPVYTAPGPSRRLNVITDSINTGHLFGGVGTALILAALKAKHTKAKLRIITRNQVAIENGFAHVLDANNIIFDENVEFVHIRVGNESDQLDICDGDRFLTTSWWTTACVLGSIPALKVEYLLQEDERMFYPYGDDWIRCSAVLSRNDIRYYINTKLLYDHLVLSGLPHLRKCAKYFEPSFPQKIFYKEEPKEKSEKRRLFFYARPNNLRNLFYRGIEVLDNAVSKNIINPDRWEIILVGKDIPQIILAGRIKPVILSTMGWRDYAKFIRTIDLGFCLMSTPHPSYPPFDLACSGAVVVTNTFGNKQDLSHYSKNILLSDLSVESLTKTLTSATQLAEDDVTRYSNYQQNQILRSWEESFYEILNTVD